LDDLHEGRVLGKEAVAGMDRFRAGDLAGGDQVRHRQIRTVRRWRPDADALVGHPDMHRVGVGGRMHRDGGNPHLLAGAMDAEGDLATVGNQDLREHARQTMIMRGAPNSTGAASSTRMRFTVPACGAGIWFIVFMASMMRSVCPSVTVSPTFTKGGAPGSGCR